METIKIRPIETPRLLLRKLTLADAPLFYSLLGGSETVTRFMLWKPHRDVSESIASIQKVLRRYETCESCRWAITLKEGDLIGIIDLLPPGEEAGTYSFAYMLGEPFWGKGYASEALKAVLAFAFRQCGADAVQADHFADNPASGAVMAKAGIRRRGFLPKKYEKGGISHDAVVYRITKEEWESEVD